MQNTSGPPPDLLESESARNVRLLLARHKQQNNINGNSMSNNKHNRLSITEIDEEEEEDDDRSDQFRSALLPGDSFPNAGQHLLKHEGDESDDDDDPERDARLLRRLQQSQARMEQIKRMLVTQRGFIVQSLKQMVESNKVSAASAPASCQRCHNGADDDLERDRTLGSTVRHSAHRIAKDRTLEAVTAEVEDEEDDVGGRLCPMCEAVFPSDVDDEAFEAHVVEHFSYEEEEPETLKYVGPAEIEEEIEEEEEFNGRH